MNDNIYVEYSHIHIECGKYFNCKILTVPHNIVMDMNNVMNVPYI